jgi:hypothetical protein
MVCHCAYESFVLMNNQLSHPKEIYSLYAKRSSNPEDELFIALVKKATQSYGKENYKAAVNYFEKALLLKPTNTNIHWNLAGLHRKLNQLDQALSHLNDYLKDQTLSKKRRKKGKNRRQQILSEMKERYLSPNGTLDANAKTPKPQDKNTQITPTPASSNDSSIPAHSPNRSEEYSNNSQDYHDRLWIIWGVTGLSLSALSVGLHVYADMTWQSRPVGGGKTAISLQDDATTVSWVADGFLLAGISTLGISLYYFLKQSANSTTTMTTKNNDPMVRISMNTLILDQNESQQTASYRLSSQLIPKLTSISVNESSILDLPQLVIDPQRAMLFWYHKF